MSRRASQPGDRPWPRFAWALGAIVLLLLFNLVFTEGFFALEVRDGRLYGSVVDIVDRATPVLLVSLGMTLVIATGGIDLSVGAVMAISGAIMAGLVARPEGSAIVALFVAVLVATGAGFGNGLLVCRLGVQPIVATLVLMVAGRGVAQLLTGGQIITVDDAFVRHVGNGSVLGLPVPIVIGLGAAAAVALLVRRTALGLFLEAVGGNPRASRICGVPSAGVTMFAYALCGLLAGVAGVVEMADIQAADSNNAGLYIELDAILAVVIGGTLLTGGRFTLTGTVIGALLIQSVTTTILSRGLSTEYTLIVKALIVLVVCLLQSQRLRLRRGRRASATREAAA